MRQFRHKHEIVRDAEAARKRLARARERLVLERKKSEGVDAEHAKVVEVVHASKQKIKSLITLIRSLALSRTQKAQAVRRGIFLDDGGGARRKGWTGRGGGGGGGELGGDEEGEEKDAAQIIDDHLEVILDLSLIHI